MASFSEILASIAALPTDDIRKLKQKLEEIDLKKDILAALPLELNCKILEDVSPLDLLTCVGVSRVWRSIVLADIVVESYCRKSFPGLMEKVSILLGDTQDRNLVRAARQREFLTALRRYSIRSQGKFSCVMFRGQWVRTEHAGQLDPAPGRGPLESSSSSQARECLCAAAEPVIRHIAHGSAKYADGILAWQLEPTEVISSVFADDLRSGMRKKFTLPPRIGGDCRLEALGNKFIVATAGASRLVAWNMQAPDDPVQTILVPEHVQAAATKGDWCVILTKTQLYLWSIGGSVVEMRCPSPLTYEQPFRWQGRLGDYEGYFISQAASVVLHPYLEGVSYLVCQRAGDHITPFLTVVEFNQRACTGQWSHRLRDCGSSYFETHDIPHIRPFAWKKTTEYGLYSLYTYVAHRPMENASVLRAVHFNIYTKTFFDSQFAFPHHVSVFGGREPHELYQPPHDRMHFWNDQVTMPIYHPSFTPDLAADELEPNCCEDDSRVPLLTATVRWEGQQQCNRSRRRRPLTGIPVYTSRNPQRRPHVMTDYEEAAQAGAGADPIIFSLEGVTPFPVTIENLSNWMGRREPLRQGEGVFGDAPPPFHMQLEECCDLDYVIEPERAVQMANNRNLPNPNADSYIPFRRLGQFYINIPHVSGDDRFLVCINQHGYAAWSFRD